MCRFAVGDADTQDWINTSLQYYGIDTDEMTLVLSMYNSMSIIHNLFYLGDKHNVLFK